MPVEERSSGEVWEELQEGCYRGYRGEVELRGGAARSEEQESSLEMTRNLCGGK